MLMKVKRTTIQDIADKTGYSKTAVSFAFNSPSRISKEAVEAILKAAEELDYIPDPMARNFSLGKHMSLGFLLPQRVEYTLMNPYMQEVIRGIAEVCQEHGYMLTLIPPLHSSVIEAVKNATAEGEEPMKILVDGGIRSGVEVFKALAMGADAVLVARPYVTAVYGGAEEGVIAYTEKLGEELRDTMSMCGAMSLDEISRDMVRI